jgi:acylphosphatase
MFCRLESLWKQACWLRKSITQTGTRMAIRRVHVLIQGRVQGVYFRETTRRLAESLGLSGYVRNLSDGRVEARFEGESQAVQQALDFVSSGPPQARVDLVSPRDAAEPDHRKTDEGFVILPTVSFQD